MKTIEEITALRKEGRIDEAYGESRELLGAYPGDRDARVTAAQSAKPVMERAAKSGDLEVLARTLEEYGALRLEEIGENEMNNKAAWDIRRYLLDAKDNRTLTHAALDRLAEAAMTIDYRRPHRYYSVLLDAFVSCKDAGDALWPGLLAFMDWWGLENLLPEDYQRVRLRNGVSMPSLAERAYSAYVKALLEEVTAGRSREEAEAFVYELDLLADSHPEFQYTLYHKTLLLKSLGKLVEAVTSAREFVKRKQNEFWSWSMLGDIVDDDALQLSCYCRALTCRAEAGYLFKVRQKAAALMEARGDLANARREYQDVIDLCQTKGWHMPADVAAASRRPWFAETEPEPSNTRYYFSHLGESEDFLLGDVDEVAILISKFNPQKQTCSFITEDRRRGFFSTKKMHERFADNQIYRVRIAGEIDGKNATKLLSIKRVDDGAPYEGRLWRRITAEINMRPGQTFTFVDDIYVDGSLLRTIPAGTRVLITAVLYFNIKRESWGWRAVRVQPV